MVDVDKAVVARLKIKGKNFEVLVDCDKAMDFRNGIGKIDDVLATTEIFKDVKIGERASEKDLEDIFGTNDAYKIAERIVKEGEVQLTSEYRKKLKEEKKKQIINIISRNAVDPRTGLPHPPERIERAMDEANVKIDEFREAEEQIQEILSQLRPILPIKFEVWEVAVKIPPTYAAKSYNVLKNYGKLLKDEWQGDGSLIAIVEIPAGMQESFFNELSKLCHGDVETKILKKK